MAFDKTEEDTTMHEEFNKIIGYEPIKRELDQLCDVLKHPGKYQRLGVKPPSGLILHGKPGLGKTLMAECLIKGSGRKVFTCRKDLPNGEFVRKIKTTFEEAAANAPSIVFLDDVDKFANGDVDFPDSEEYVTVQACIDQAKGKNVFVLATANSLRNLPQSLLRCGRFDREIKVSHPSKADSGSIIRHYLSSKPVDRDLDLDLIVRIMDGCSCAELESVLNEAGLCAAYTNSETIKMEHFLEACLPVIFDAPAKQFFENDTAWKDALLDSNSEKAMIAYHEAGHVVVAEALEPGVVTVASVHGRHGSKGGFTAYCNHGDRLIVSNQVKEIAGALGGIAAIDQKFGFRSAGGSSDLSKAFAMMRGLIVYDCIFGMEYYSYPEETSENRARQEVRTAAEIECLYQKAKMILAANNALLDAVAEALAAKGVITACDITGLREKHKLVCSAL